LRAGFAAFDLRKGIYPSEEHSDELYPSSIAVQRSWGKAKTNEHSGVR